MTPGVAVNQTIVPEPIRAAVQALRNCHGQMRAAENALRSGHRDAAAMMAACGLEDAKLAAAECAKIGDAIRGLREIAVDTSSHSLRPAGQMVAAVGGRIAP